MYLFLKQNEVVYLNVNDYAASQLDFYILYQVLLNIGIFVVNLADVVNNYINVECTEYILSAKIAFLLFVPIESLIGICTYYTTK